MRLKWFAELRARIRSGLDPDGKRRMNSRRGSLVQLNVAVLLWGGTAMFAKGVALPVGQIICLRTVAGGLLILACIAFETARNVGQA